MTRHEIWVAPFLGEFGWECMVWRPWLAHQAQAVSKNSQMLVMCREGHEALYEGIADRTVSIPDEQASMLAAITKRDCQHAWWPNGTRLSKEDYLNMGRAASGRNVRAITPWDLPISWPVNGVPKAVVAMHRPLMCEADLLKRPAYLLHARNLDRCPMRNWSEECWSELVGHLGGHGQLIGCIGHPKEALHVPGTVDYRGLPVGQLAGIIKNAERVIGPSSGPLHLANLCRTPVTWWSGNFKDKDRYARTWNPFDCDNQQVGDSWNPTPLQVYQALC